MKSRSFSCDAVLCLSRFVPRFGVTAAVGLLLAAAIPGWSQTATSAVPGLFNFQGKVANANGTLVGAGTPVNKTVIFRIWDHSTNSTTGNLVYSEQQNVTITDGEFSVLIGQGTAVSGTPLGYSETAKGPSTTTIASAAVFGGAWGWRWRKSARCHGPPRIRRRSARSARCWPRPMSSTWSAAASPRPTSSRASTCRWPRASSSSSRSPASRSGKALLTGGLALDTGLLAAIREEMANEKVGVEAVAHADSIHAGAIGAALWGEFRHRKLASLAERVAA